MKVVTNLIYSSCFFALSIVMLIGFSSCEKDKGTSSGNEIINKIMPLGASRVQGARPQFESFRFELWKDLTENGWSFDFIGTQSDQADYDEEAFDVDHEGRGGWTSSQILNNIDSWLEETGSPDIVLFSSPGGNDALQGMPYEGIIDNINAIIDKLQSNNPNVTIIVEQLAPGRSDLMTGQLAIYFDQMQQDILAIADEQTTNMSEVLAVDMFTGFTDDLLADPIHYNEAGADFIASRYYEKLIEILE